MGNPLRDRRTPKELAASRQVIDFAIKITDLEQLTAIVEGDLETLDPDKLPSGWRETQATGQLRFGFADAQEALPQLEGEVSATIDVVCQRCLEPLSLPLAVELKLLFAADEAVDGGDDFEVWELDEESIRPLDVVEEALIMALPLAAMHDNEKCRSPDEAEAGESVTIRPFAALKSQMEKEN
ncbi:MAG: hypothetical protein GTO71_00705 [Woeseiaceae bacterium]|nr:hypothetical protein [Woeseiaceae bacterium]NIP19639.1 hypothetical protein [Woeseiaceae bacterium]NIS89756.1 hypothetical protein [Woeseiaceae bacterium]